MLTGGCLDENAVIAFLAGRTPAPQRPVVESHLQTCNACADLVIWVAADLAHQSRAPGEEGRPFIGPLAAGARVDRYQILGAVGRGGMGEVYAAYHPDLDRRVALKVVHELGADSADRRARLLREARAIARLSHPNVVTVHDAGTFDDRVFIAMEFVEGQTVDAWLRAQRTQLARGAGRLRRRRAGAGGGACRGRRTPGFQAAERDDRKERVGTRHGLRPGAAGGRALAPPTIDEDGLGAYAPALSTVTKTGALIGTPAYMSPEQFRREPIDARADQFSFCVALYEALYGERPFPGDTPMAQASDVAIRDASAGAKVPSWIRKVLLRGLRVKPDERFPSMHDLLAALTRDPNVTRRKVVASAAGVVLMLAMAIGGRGILGNQTAACAGGPEKLVGIWDLRAPGGEEPPRHARVREAFTRTGKSYAGDVFATASRTLTSYAQSWAAMYRDACEATAVRKAQSTEVLDLRMSCLQERLAGLRALTDVFADGTAEVVDHAASGANALAPLERCADVPVLRAVVQPPADPATRAKVSALRTRLSELKARFDAGKFKDAVRDAPALVAEAQELRYLPVVAEAQQLHGLILLKANDSGGAAAVSKEAFVTADAARHDEVRAVAAGQLLFILGCLQGHFEEAHAWARIAEAVLQRLGGHELMRAWYLNNLGSVLDLEGKKEKAIRVYQEAIALKEKVLGRDHPDVGLSEGNLAALLTDLDRNLEALAHANRAIELIEKSLGPQHPDLANPLNNRGEALAALGRPGEARASFERARELFARELGPEDPSLSYALNGIGNSYLAEGDAPEAL